MMNEEKNKKGSYSSSDDHIGDDNNVDGKKEREETWGTWEELLLACAVKRHGFRDWDSVAMEVQSRTSLLTTPHNCKLKYRDLRSRYLHESPATNEGDGKNETEDDDSIPWLEQLRSLRVAELRRELHQYDVSILSLQLKVKKLEEERERNVGKQKVDLDDDSKGERSESEGTEPARTNSEKTVTEMESERENRSINESNSTASAADGDKRSQAREASGNPDPDPVCKAEEEEVEEEEEGSLSRGSEVSHSGESGMGERWKRKGRKKKSGKEGLGGGGGGGEKRSMAGKSEPLIKFLEMIRAHPRGSLFHRRLRSQETKDYKSLIRQHLDLETIQIKLDQGSYSSSTLSFYRDLHLLFTNAIVFFPKSSSESLAARELRALVNKIEEEFGKSDSSLPHLSRGDTSLIVKPDPETSDSSFARQKSSAPLVVCKKRSLVSMNPSSPSSSFSKKEDKKLDEVSGDKDKGVTGVRSLRKANKGVSAIAKNTETSGATNNKKQKGSKMNSPSDTKQETPKTDEKTLASEKKSVQDFLKRITNSPKKGGSKSKDHNKTGGSGKKDTKPKQRQLRSNNADKNKTEEDNTPLKRNMGRQQRKKAASVAASSSKRGRETSGGDRKSDNKQQPKKRCRS